MLVRAESLSAHVQADMAHRGRPAADEVDDWAGGPVFDWGVDRLNVVADRLEQLNEHAGQLPYLNGAWHP